MDAVPCRKYTMRPLYVRFRTVRTPAGRELSENGRLTTLVLLLTLEHPHP